MKTYVSRCYYRNKAVSRKKFLIARHTYSYSRNKSCFYSHTVSWARVSSFPNSFSFFKLMSVSRCRNIQYIFWIHLIFCRKIGKIIYSCTKVEQRWNRFASMTFSWLNFMKNLPLRVGVRIILIRTLGITEDTTIAQMITFVS